ncbi:MAG: hypothetical protein HRU20_31860 [Pseudomonadales bacterium]|nr:hypothetical protein [Pseudomonadales bacterium]
MKVMQSLFWQLYFSIIAAVLLIVMVLAGLLLYDDHKTSENDFYRDSFFTVKPLLNSWEKDGEIPQALLQQVREVNYFEVLIADDEKLFQHLANAEHISDIKSAKIYHQMSDTSLFLAVYALADSGLWLVIKDLDIDPDSDMISEQMREDFELELREERDFQTNMQISFVAMLILIAAVLMLLVKRIDRHIESLLSTNQQWSKGELSARANTNLPSPMNKLAISFNHMASDMEQSITKQKIMMHAISHELRTPLSKLQLALDLLQRKMPSLRSEPLLSDLDRYVDELELLVNEILTLAKLNHVKKLGMNCRLELYPLVHERINELQQLHPDKKITTKGDKAIELWADEFYLQMLIDNVLKNALKYADKDVLVTLTAEKTAVCMIFEDDGPGVAAEYREAMLLAFSREDESRNKNSGGFGLGLAIVDAIVKQYGGSIRLGESTLGGFLVHIELPYKPVI